MEAKRLSLLDFILIIYCLGLSVNKVYAFTRTETPFKSDKTSISATSTNSHIKTENDSDIFPPDFSANSYFNLSISSEEFVENFNLTKDVLTVSDNSTDDEFAAILKEYNETSDDHDDLLFSDKHARSNVSNFHEYDVIVFDRNDTENSSRIKDLENSMPTPNSKFNDSESFVLYNDPEAMPRGSFPMYPNVSLKNEALISLKDPSTDSSFSKRGGMKEEILPGMVSWSSSPTFASFKRSDSVRQGRQANFNKAGRRARLPIESNNALKKDTDKPQTVTRSSLVPSIAEGNSTDSEQDFDNETRSSKDPELMELLQVMRAGRAGSPVLFGAANDPQTYERCSLPSGGEGVCTVLVECRAILRTIRSQNPVICRWIRDMPVVCCPQYGQDSEHLGRRIPGIQGCGKRIIPGIDGPSRRVVRQVARFIPDFAPTLSPGEIKKAQVIAGGKDTVIGAWPWMAGIYTRNFGIENFLCGAAIISQYQLVTAAHCFGVSGASSARISPARYAVRVGSIKVREGTLHLIDKITIHPDYIPREYYNDIAVIRLKEPIAFGPNVQPICLPSTPEIRRKKLKGRDVTVIGWGDQEFGGRRATVLQEVTVKVIDPPTCDQAYKDQRSAIPRGITTQFLCAGVPEGGKDACQRDSGGPLMLLENDVWILVGIVSFGFQCAQPGYPGVYTRATSYLDWLQEVASVS